MRSIEGITAISLGDSRARGNHTNKSDVDLEIYYNSENLPDLKQLNRLASELDNKGRVNLITAIGEWGKWINGGGWLISKPSTAKCDLNTYTLFLLAESKYPGCTRLAEIMENLSHDSVNRFLLRERVGRWRVPWSFRVWRGKGTTSPAELGFKLGCGAHLRES